MEKVVEKYLPSTLEKGDIKYFRGQRLRLDMMLLGQFLFCFGS